ncbi:MAG: F0F1 ATP synthase subunit A [Enterocloster aldenensis]
MSDLVGSLMEELNCNVVFTIPLFGGIPILESVVVTWIIMAVLMAASLLLVHGLKVRPINNKQAALESGISFIYDFFEGLLGKDGKDYIPYLITVVLYIGIANMIGLFGFKSPTKDLNVTASLAVMSIVLVETAGIRKKGVKGWIKSFAEPIPIIAPINVLELFIRPLSLCMRLFGNVLGAIVVMALIKHLVPLVVPLPFSFYFDIFDGVIQAYVFVFLTSLYIKRQLKTDGFKPNENFMRKRRILL